MSTTRSILAAERLGNGTGTIFRATHRREPLEWGDGLCRRSRTISSVDGSSPVEETSLDSDRFDRGVYVRRMDLFRSFDRRAARTLQQFALAAMVGARLSPLLRVVVFWRLTSGRIKVRSRSI